MDAVEEFNEYREKMNAKIMAEDNLVIKRIFNLDTNAFKPGTLDATSKELMGLVASMVLRCDDCIKYHLEKCYDLGVTKPALFETFSVATTVGGTIIIPHLRKAVEYWEVLENR